jgi:hypothetical protein
MPCTAASSWYRPAHLELLLVGNGANDCQSPGGGWVGVGGEPWTDAITKERYVGASGSGPSYARPDHAADDASRITTRRCAIIRT